MLRNLKLRQSGSVYLCVCVRACALNDSYLDTRVDALCI
jgi:hypothetical protein